MGKRRALVLVCKEYPLFLVAFLMMSIGCIGFFIPILLYLGSSISIIGMMLFIVAYADIANHNDFVVSLEIEDSIE
jgi:hypothetical protein